MKKLSTILSCVFIPELWIVATILAIIAGTFSLAAVKRGSLDVDARIEYALHDNE